MNLEQKLELRMNLLVNIRERYPAPASEVWLRRQAHYQLEFRVDDQVLSDTLELLVNNDPQFVALEPLCYGKARNYRATVQLVSPYPLNSHTTINAMYHHD